MLLWKLGSIFFSTDPELILDLDQDPILDTGMDSNPDILYSIFDDFKQLLIIESGYNFPTIFKKKFCITFGPGSVEEKKMDPWPCLTRPARGATCCTGRGRQASCRTDRSP